MENYQVPAHVIQAVVNVLIESDVRGLARIGRDSLVVMIQDLVKKQEAEFEAGQQKEKEEKMRATLKTEIENALFTEVKP